MNIQAEHDNSITRVVVALDTAKAFDSVVWQYLWECLHGFGFGPNFIKWLQLLYQTPKAWMFVNRWLSDQISPLLYALAAEPLAMAIRTEPNIAGLRQGSSLEKIGLYVDDTMLYLADQGPSLQAVLEIIERLGKFSGLRINWDKSQILPLNQSPPTPIYPKLPFN